MNELLIWTLAVLAAAIVATLLWLGRRRQQQAREQAARREAAALAQAAQAAHAERARRLAEQEQQTAEREARAQAERAVAAAAAAHAEAERLETERLENERLAREAQAARAAEAAAEAHRQAEERAEAERQRAERETAAREAAERLAREAEAAASAAATAAAARATRELRADETLVLVADDSKIVRVKLSRLLAAQGYRVALAESGEQALELLAAECPHLLITDVEMPGIDGFELTRRVRAGAATAALPVVMITSSDDKHDEATAAGVSRLLGKPYSEEALIGAIEQARLAVRVPA